VQEFIDEFVELTPFGQGALMDALLKAVRERTQIAVLRNDFKLDMLQPHLFMNFRVVDEHGRQLGMGRHLPTLKADLGGQARSAFQALAALKLGSTIAPTPTSPEPAAAPAGAPKKGERVATPAEAPAPAAPATYTSWTFGELPELMEIRKGNQTLVGFPALIDRGTEVAIEVFDEPDVAAAKHRAGLRRLVALQIRDALKYLEKNIADLQKMSVLFMPIGTADELRDQIIDLALDRAFLADPLPTDAVAFRRRIDEGRGRLTLIAQEIARSALQVLTEYAAATRKLKDTRAPKDLADDAQAQLARLVPKRFLTTTSWMQLAHVPRYLKAIVLRLEKWRSDPARDAARLAELRPIEQRYLRTLAERKGVADARLEEFRWLLEELRVSLFAQELRTPQPVSVKRLEKAWTQLCA
jgi:ATP-dependent helicase HrpA